MYFKHHVYKICILLNGSKLYYDLEEEHIFYP